MHQDISNVLKQKIQSMSDNDSILLEDSSFPVHQANFKTLSCENQKLAFIDGGQANILTSSNFCLEFIRVACFEWPSKKQTIQEFYLLTLAHYDQDIQFTSHIFGDKLFDPELLTISSQNTAITTGKQRASITAIATMARRFAELSMARTSHAEHIILDGTLQPTFPHEDTLLNQLPPNVSALAKTSNLFTQNGNSPTILLKRLGPSEPWVYPVTDKTFFTKLHAQAKHVFRFEGNPQALPSLCANAKDALFLGYPYGLIAVDKIARVSNTEKQNLSLKFLLNKDNKEILQYLSTSNAHDILDNL